MILYGVAALAASVLAGTIIGEILGQLLGVDANVGGVGFGMILLIALTTWLRSKGKLPAPTEHGVLFWNAMYIPIVVAMAAIQNVYAAVGAGPVALAAGVAATVVSLAMVPLLSKIGAPSEPLPDVEEPGETAEPTETADRAATAESADSAERAEATESRGR